VSYWKHRRVLVTGGGGFIGRNLVERLVAEGAQVRVAEIFERSGVNGLAALEKQIELVQADLREEHVCLRVCSEVEVVFHLASKVGSSAFYRDYPADVVLQNLMLDAQMLEAARKRGVARYLHVSSAFIYPVACLQNPEGAPIKEEQAYPANPALSYGWAKLLAEKALEYAATQAGELCGAILRLSNVYGPHQSLDLERGSIIPVLIRRAVEFPARQPFTIFGAGLETRTYCFVSDAVEAMLRAVETLEHCRLVGPLNIGGEERIRIIDLARKIIALSGKDIEPVTLPAPPPATQSQSLDCSKARATLAGWRPKVSLDQGLSLLYRHVEAELQASAEPVQPKGDADHHAGANDRPPAPAVDDKINLKIRSLTGLTPNFESVDDDVFIIGHPKSGTTWFQNLVAGVVYGVDPEYAPYALVRDLVPGHLQLYYKRYRTPAFFKSHELPKPEYKRVVYLVRDGRDVMVSYHHHMETVKQKPIDMLKVVRGKKSMWPFTWQEHVEAWLVNPYQAQLLVIKYEDLQADTLKELQRFCAFVGLERDNAFLKQVAQKASFESLRRKEMREGIANPNWPKDQLFMRRGEIGSYQDEMPEDALEAFMREAGETMRKLGYL